MAQFQFKISLYAAKAGGRGFIFCYGVPSLGTPTNSEVVDPRGRTQSAPLSVPYPFAQWTNPISKGFCRSECEGTTRKV